MYYGIIDLVPSSSTKLRAIIEESDLNEIIDQVKKNTRTGRAAQGPDGATYQDVKSFAVEIFGPAVSS